MDIIEFVKNIPMIEDTDPPKFSFRDVVCFILGGKVDGPEDGPIEEFIFPDYIIPPTNQEVLDKLNEIKLIINERYNL